MLYKNNKFILKGNYKPAGDQPTSIKLLIENLKKKKEKLTLLGATGTGKTFTIANVINEIQKPTLVIAHNKTLAAQLAQEFREFFPDAAVHYFVSYYDYYQPEAYMPVTDTYIEKDASINEEIDRLRHASTQALLTRRDVIICASVSCIYGLGSPVEYEKENKILQVGDKISKTELMKDFINIYYERTNADLSPGQFRSIGNRIDIMSIGETEMLQIEIFNDRIEKMFLINPISMTIIRELEEYFIFPAKHFISDKKKLDIYIKNIKDELKSQLKKFEKEGKLLESERLSRRTSYDLAMIKEIGYCSGIENYSRHLSGKKEGEPPETLLSYFPHSKDGEADFLTVIDESHITLPQIGAMYAGDQSRKGTLVEHGFRLPSAKDNRPLTYQEFNKRVGQRIFVSATPGKEEREEGATIIEQIIRPTGLVDPKLEIRPVGETSDWQNTSHITDISQNTSPTPNPSPEGVGTGSGIKTSNLNNYESLKKMALTMRKNPTKEEEKLWDILTDTKYINSKFRRQHIVDNFIVDFIELKHKLIIEVDGEIHSNQKERDYERDDILRSLGFNILRFTNKQINNNIENVIVEIKKSLADTPRPFRGGVGGGANNKDNPNLFNGMVVGGANNKVEDKAKRVMKKYPGQVYDFINEAEKTIKNGGRVLSTTLTKKMAENLSQFLKEKNIKAEYLHSDVKTIERIEILTRLRKGEIDCLVGVNLLREGLDLPEVSLIGILDADKEGFLRSDTSLIQTIGRAARNVDGRVILYADSITGSMERAIGETNRRRDIQLAYNKKHNITPTTIKKEIKDITESIRRDHNKTLKEELSIDEKLFKKNPNKLLKLKEKQMMEAVKVLDFETAAILRDEIQILKDKMVS